MIPMRLSLAISSLVFLTLIFASAAASAPPNLAASLSQRKPPANTVFLTVSAAQCPLPSGETAPNPEDSFQVVANTYHRVIRVFGSVTAIAPPTMTLLNSNPVPLNIYDGMSPQEAVKFLVATLTEAQWQQLASK